MYQGRIKNALRQQSVPLIFLWSPKAGVKWHSGQYILAMIHHKRANHYGVTEFQS